MAWPVLPWAIGAAMTALGVTGVKKGYDAKVNYDKAKNIGESSEKRYNEAVDHLESDRQSVNKMLEDFGSLKINVFSTQIKHLVDAIKKSRKAGSELQGYDIRLTSEEIIAIEQAVVKSLELKRGLASGALAGTLAGVGAYGAVGYLGVASTGAAISGLSGVAATNATLAWLGGGSLAAGGLGMAAGTAVLYSIVAGPMIAVGGFWLASKAEEALTEALAYSAKVDVAIAEIRKAETLMAGYKVNIKELTMAISNMVERFESIKVDDDLDIDAFNKMIAFGKTLKYLLDIPIMGNDGDPTPGVKAKIDGYLALQ